MIRRRRPLLRGAAVAGAGVAAGSAIAHHRDAAREQQAETEAETEDMQVEEAPAAPAPASSTASDRIDEIRQLAELRDSGALTEAEFAAEKARVLQG